jgi:sodium-dependent dicarboxylate transporter 2/3/5
MSAIFVYIILIGSMLFLTELMSNVALATIYIPVVIGIANGLGMNPLLLAIPVAMAASCAFMMPISTPPNAIVFSSGHIRVRQMIKAGFLLNLISVLILVLAAFTIIDWVFG